MKPLNKAATEIMNQLTEGLKEPGDARKIDNASGTFMAVHVEMIARTDSGALFSVAHYYRQNGDAMRDPDMTFLRIGKEYYPLTYQQDGLCAYEEYVVFNDHGTAICVAPTGQRKAVSFANGWMRNIRWQQGL